MVKSKGIGRGGRLPRRELSREEEVALLEKWEPLCKTLANRVLMGPNGRWVEFDDALQEARMLLLDSARLFDPERGVKEITYFTAHIRGKLRSWMRTQAMIWVPSYLQEGGGGEAPPEDRRRSAKKYAGAAAMASRVVQSQSLYDEGNQDWVEAWAGFAEDHHGDGEMVAPFLAVRAAVDRLPHRLGLVIKMRFGMGAWARTEPCGGSRFYNHRWHKSLSFIGRHLGLTRERVRQLQGEALAMLWEMLAGVEVPA